VLASGDVRAVLYCEVQHLTRRRFLCRCLDWSDVLSPERGAMISTSRGRHDESERTTPAPPPVGTAEHSVVAPRTDRSWARKFTDPHDVTWWVHLVRADVQQSITRRSQRAAITLRFQSGINARPRYLFPIPSDWRECDDVTLWAYCEQATW
jgi:hypothetical protein